MIVSRCINYVIYVTYTPFIRDLRIYYTWFIYIYIYIMRDYTPILYMKVGIFTSSLAMKNRAKHGWMETCKYGEKRRGSSSSSERNNTSFYWQSPPSLFFDILMVFCDSITFVITIHATNYCWILDKNDAVWGT